MSPHRPVLHSRILLLACAWLATAPSPARAALPAGFQATTIATDLSLPTTLAFLPDGRLLVAEKTGRLRLVKNGLLVTTPFLDAADLVPPPARFDDAAERGLIGVAVDPDFPAQPFVYLYYSLCNTPGAGSSCTLARNRVARVTVGYEGSPDRADPASQLVLLDDIESDTGIHNGGWLGFGPLDGKLYVAIGDSGTGGVKAQDLGALNGKVLRIDPSGTAPLDNPFAGVFGARPEIWALGFRNPWRCRFHPEGQLFCGDVGQADWEEIDLVLAGGNYGWPLTEGKFNAAQYPTFEQPIHAYDHSDGGSITLGDFGSETNFPGEYQRSFFFGDYSWQWIRRVVLADDGVTVVSSTGIGFESMSGGVTDLITGPDGALYSADVLAGTVRRIATTGSNQPPVARVTADPTAGGPPLDVQFSSVGTSDADGDPLTLTWNFGDGSPPTSEANPTHTYLVAGGYTASLTVSDGRSPTPGTDTVTVPIIVGTPPEVTIVAPIADSPYVGGQIIPLAGSASDAEDGDLAATSLHWEIRFHHAAHWHPFVTDLPGSPEEFTTATNNETASDVSYRIILRATDSSGLTGESSVSIRPQVTTLRFETSPPGLQIQLDGQPRATPFEVTGVVGVLRVIGAPSPQAEQTFDAWSDGGVQVHTISTPATDTTYTAVFDVPATTTTTAPATTSTTAPPTSTTTSSTTSTEAPTSTTTSSSTTVPSTTSTTAPSTSTTLPTSTTTTSTTTEPGSTSTTSTSSTSGTMSTSTSATVSSTSSTAAPSSSSTSVSATTVVPSSSTTVPPRCAPGLAPQDLSCRIDDLSDRITNGSTDLGRLAPGLDRQLAHAVGRVQRATELCDAGRLARARAALRTASRRLQASLAKIRSRAGRRLIKPEVAAELDPLFATALADVKALRDGLTCP